jgi:hypothetical protein
MARDVAPPWPQRSFPWPYHLVLPLLASYHCCSRRPVVGPSTMRSAA